MSVCLNENELKNNIVVRSGFEFVEERPLGFFNFENDSDKDTFKHKDIDKEIKGTLKVRNYGFEPVKDINGNLRSPEVYVVSRAKARPVLILQDIEFCNAYHNNVFVIPIQTLHKPSKDDRDFNYQMEKYLKIKSRDDEYFNYYYFPQLVGNEECYERALILSDARFIHKSLLFDIIEENGLSQSDLDEVTLRLSKMLNIKNIEECKTCKVNCENCEYIFMFENLKKIINRVERITNKKDA